MFSAIGFKLGNEYLVLYRSFASPQTDVNVKIAVAGYPPLPKISYTSPALAGVTASFHKSTLDRIVQSPLSVILLVVLILLLLAYAVSKLFSLRGRSFRSRMSSFVDFDDDDDTGLRREEIRAALADADTSFQRSRFIRGFADDVALAGIRMSPLALVFFSIVIALFVGMVLAVIGNAPIFLLLAFTGPIFLRMFVTSKVERKRRAFGDQLSDNLDVLAQSLRAGHSLPGALSVVADSAPEPSHEELARVISDERLGVPLEDALGSCVTRMQSRDLEQVALVALLQRDAGGNAAEVIDQVAYNIRTRQELRRLARTLTAQGRMTRWILTALPIAVFLGIYLIDSNYLAPLWQTTRARSASSSGSSWSRSAPTPSSASSTSRSEHGSHRDHRLARLRLGGVHARAGARRHGRARRHRGADPVVRLSERRRQVAGEPEAVTRRARRVDRDAHEKLALRDGRGGHAGPARAGRHVLDLPRPPARATRCSSRPGWAS